MISKTYSKWSRWNKSVGWKERKIRWWSMVEREVEVDASSSRNIYFIKDGDTARVFYSGLDATALLQQKPQEWANSFREEFLLPSLTSPSPQPPPPISIHSTKGRSFQSSINSIIVIDDYLLQAIPTILDRCLQNVPSAKPISPISPILPNIALLNFEK